MIPRFIVINSGPTIIDGLIKLGYTCNENPVPVNILVIGTSIVPAPPDGKNELIRKINYTGTAESSIEIFEQAVRHLDWQESKTKDSVKTLELGTKNILVYVGFKGVLIDSYVVPLVIFYDLLSAVNRFTIGSLLTTHKPTINTKAFFLTIGCADYSVDDFKKIVFAYDSLTP